MLELQAAIAAFMTGLIWFVQVVHYPLFAQVGLDQSIIYARLHSQRTTWVVLAPMLMELAIAAALIWQRPPAIPAFLAWVGLALVGVIWASTFFLQAPCHQRLGAGFDDAAHQLLVATNWMRTASWTIRTLIAFWMLRLNRTP